MHFKTMHKMGGMIDKLNKSKAIEYNILQPMTNNIDLFIVTNSRI